MKKATKLLSVLLAFVMVISMFAATFAASAAKATYTELVTEEDVDLMLEDVNTLLAGEALNGDAIEAIYKFLPSLSAFLNDGGATNSATGAFYKAAQPERFAELTDDETPVKDADIPKTGAAVSIGFGALSLAAAGALVLLRVRAKKNNVI